MSLNLFEDPIEYVAIAPGHSPSWFPARPITPRPEFGQKVSTWYFDCGCVRFTTTTIDFEEHEHPHVLPENWDSVIVKKEVWCRPGTILSMKEDICDICKRCNLLGIDDTDLNSEWKSLSSTEQGEIKEDCFRIICRRKVARKGFYERRIRIMNEAWRAHTDKLLLQGVLELQPNVMAKINDTVYKFRHHRLEDGVIEIFTISEDEDWNTSIRFMHVCPRLHVRSWLATRRNRRKSIQKAFASRASDPDSQCKILLVGVLLLTFG
ncbi:hypothetical protein VTL71DRAFT_14289 [Oculimacula yallundae]|uniref:Uncharacterized protein n=1 Tax=Oculimacula yallundae TaxID=86028 RepID=A0ABR4CIP7_9HELO